MSCTLLYIAQLIAHYECRVHTTLYYTVLPYTHIIIYNTPTATLPMKYYNLERWEMEEYHNKQRQQASAAHSSSSSSSGGGDMLGMYMNIGYIHTYCMYTLLYLRLVYVYIYTLLYVYITV